MSVNVYDWYIKNGEFDGELLSKMQLECFNKRLEPAVVITGNDLNRIDDALADDTITKEGFGAE